MEVRTTYDKDAVADIIFLCPDFDVNYQELFGPDYPHPLEHLGKVTPEPHNLIIVADKGPEFRFGRSVTEGVKNSRTDMLIVYSDDVYMETGWLTGIMDAFRIDPKLGICGAVQYEKNANPSPGNSSNKLKHIGARFDPNTITAYQLPRKGGDPAEVHFETRWARTCADDEIPEKDRIIYSDWVNGAVFAVPRKVWDEVGGMDPRFKFFWEDVDLCLRIAKLGYGVGVHFDVAGIHIGGATVRHMEGFSQDESRKLMIEKVRDEEDE